jgi:hypothetical protein
MAQWGFVGGAYEAANPAQDSQRLINWYVEMDGNENNPLQPGVIGAEAKVALGLLGVPGLSALSQSYSGQVRGAWVLPGNKQCLFVIGNQVILAEVSVPASAAAPAKIVFSIAGPATLNSWTGPVKIRDNGAGKIAVIVDGPNLYVYNVTGRSVTISTDPAFLGSNTVAEIDGWFIFQQPNTQLFYTSPIYWNGVSAFDGTYFALKDDSPDNIVAIIENGRQLWLIGEATTEPWYNAGGAFFPFARLEGGLMQIGCAAAQSVARTGPDLIWLARSERGENAVVMVKGYQYTAISNPALSYALTQYPVISDAIGYVYSEEGHEFYVLVFPTADTTWVYDLTTSMWHQRASFDPVQGKFHRQRLNCLVNFAGMRMGGDYANGRIYQQSRQFYADDQYPLVALRRAPHVWDKDNRNRVVHSRLQLDFFPGSGLATGQGINPPVMLRWSDDGGQKWGNEHWTGIGKIGETKNRAIWRRLGSSRDRVYEASISDPVKRDVAGASIEVTGTKA